MLKARVRGKVVVLLLTAAFAGCGGANGSGADSVEEQIGEQIEENRESLPNDTDSEAPVPKRSLVEFIREHQTLGFFAREDADDAARRVDRAHREEWGEEAQIATRLDELTLLAYDRRRVWFEDIERDVVEGNDEYVAAFREWARIAGRGFRPRDISERWRGEDGPVTIGFRLDGRRHKVQAAAQGDFLDLCVLTAGINPLIRESGRQFAIYRPDAALGQSAFVVALTGKERRALERRGWTFATPEEVRLAFGYGQLYEEGDAEACA